MTVGEAGEEAVISELIHASREALVNQADDRPPQSVGSTVIVDAGDDAAVIDLTPGATPGSVIVTVDTLVEGRHFRREWSSGVHIGRRAIAQNAADIAAMGGLCSGFVCAVALPASVTMGFVAELGRGFGQEARLCGARVIGGDLVQADEIVISVTAVGLLSGAPVRLSGAKIGDTLAISGPVGGSAAGLSLLRAGMDPWSDDLPKQVRNLIAAYRVPAIEPSAGLVAREAGATAMTDVSDSLVADAGAIASASQTSIDIDLDQVPRPCELDTAARYLGCGVDPWAMSGGEDHVLLATFPTTEIPVGWSIIGRVTPPSQSPVTVTSRGGALDLATVTSWTSFSH